MTSLKWTTRDWKWTTRLYDQPDVNDPLNCWYRISITSFRNGGRYGVVAAFNHYPTKEDFRRTKSAALNTWRRAIGLK